MKQRREGRREVVVGRRRDRRGSLVLFKGRPGQELQLGPRRTGQGGLQLPSVDIEGATKGQKLETPLGTVVRFQREGVEYTVGGSVPAAVALEAAQGL